MSSSFISFGLTINPEILAALDIETIEAAVDSHKDEFLAKIDDIDASGFIENITAVDLDSDGAADELRQGLVSHIIEGVAWLQENWADQGVFTVPGNKGYRFVTGGGSTWGDSPFDEYDALIIAASAAEVVPEFGAAMGIVGGGIRA